MRPSGWGQLLRRQAVDLQGIRANGPDGRRPPPDCRSRGRAPAGVRGTAAPRRPRPASARGAGGPQRPEPAARHRRRGPRGRTPRPGPSADRRPAADRRHHARRGGRPQTETRPARAGSDQVDGSDDRLGVGGWRRRRRGKQSLGRESEQSREEEQAEGAETISRRAHREQRVPCPAVGRPCGPTDGSRGGTRTNGRCDGRHSFAHLLSIHAARSAGTHPPRRPAYCGGICLCSLWHSARNSLCGLGIPLTRRPPSPTSKVSPQPRLRSSVRFQLRLTPRDCPVPPRTPPPSRPYRPPGRTARVEEPGFTGSRYPQRQQPRRNDWRGFVLYGRLNGYGLLEIGRTHPGSGAGPRQRRGADGRLHEPGGVGPDAPHGLRDLLQPDAQHAVDQGRNLGQPARGARHARSTATRTPCSSRRSASATATSVTPARAPASLSARRA